MLFSFSASLSSSLDAFVATVGCSSNDAAPRGAFLNSGAGVRVSAAGVVTERPNGFLLPRGCSPPSVLDEDEEAVRGFTPPSLLSPSAEAVVEDDSVAGAEDRDFLLLLLSAFVLPLPLPLFFLLSALACAAACCSIFLRFSFW